MLYDLVLLRGRLFNVTHFLITRRCIRRVNHNVDKCTIMSFHKVLRFLPSRELRDVLRWEECVHQPKASKRQEESDRIGNIIESLDTQWCMDTHLVEKSIEIGCNGNQIDRKCSWVEAVEEVVSRVFVSRIKHGDIEATAPKEVIVADQDTRDGAKEDLVRAQEVDEHSCG